MAGKKNLSAALERVRRDLGQLQRPYALVGGFAVSARAEPRFTRDLDFVVAVGNDADAEQVITELGYVIRATVEQTTTSRLATVRLTVPASNGIVVDLTRVGGQRWHTRPTRAGVRFRAPRTCRP